MKEYIQATEVMQIYQKAFNVPWWMMLFRNPFQLADQKYVVTNSKDIAEVLALDKIDIYQYAAEEFDCDDFAFALMGAFHHHLKTASMPIFITWVNTPRGGHAVLSYIHEDGKVRIIEPQSDLIMFVPENWSLLLLCG